MRIHLLILLALLAACPAKADIAFVAVGPVTGQDAATGEQMQRGATAAVDAINAAGGVLGQTLRLAVADDVCDPKQGVAIANQLGGSEVAAVIGPMCSGTAIPAARVLNEEGIVMISPSATSPVLTTQGFDNVFRTCGRDDQQGATVADFIATHYPGKHVAIIADRTAYGEGLAVEVGKSLSRRNYPVRLTDSITRGERDYAALIAKLRENTIDVVFFGGYHTEAGLIVRQLRDQGMTTVFIGGDDLTTAEFWSITGAAGENTFMSFNTDPRNRPEAGAAVAHIRASGFDPEGITLYTYAAAQVMAQAINRAGTTAEKKVIAAMHEGSYPTVIGDLSFDAHGDVTRPDYIMYRWTHGAYRPVAVQPPR